MGDPTRVAQVVSNLLNNASKYTPGGGQIELSVRGDGAQIEILVRDNGIGIPEERLEEVSEMFAQIEQPSDRLQGGLGIGLALVRRLVEMHGGSVKAASGGPGKGSTFTVRLLVDETGVEPQASDEGAPLSVVAGKRRVLIVDGNEDARAPRGHAPAGRLRDIHGGGRSERPGGCARAGAEHRHSRYRVAWDERLRWQRSLRQIPSLSSAAIVALSGWGSPEDKRRALEAGFDIHLTKPVFADETGPCAGSARSRRMMARAPHGTADRTRACARRWSYRSSDAELRW